MQYDPNIEPEDQLLSDLLNLRNLFADRNRWCKKTWEDDSAEDGSSYCILGGIQKVVAGKVLEHKTGLRWFLSSNNFARAGAMVKALVAAGWKRKDSREVEEQEERLLRWNDSRATFAKLLALIDRAIQMRVEAKTLERAKAAVLAE